MTLKHQTAEVATPLAAGVLLLLFFAGVGVWYCVKNWRKIRRWWRRTTRKKGFWGYVLGAVLFVGFGAYFAFLGFKY